MGAEAGGEGADGGGVVVPPVHSGLFAASGDISPAGGLDGAGSDEEPLFPVLAVAHVFGTALDVCELLPCRMSVAERGVAPLQGPDERVRAEPVEERSGAEILAAVSGSASASVTKAWRYSQAW